MARVESAADQVVDAIATREVFVGRQPILDREGQLFGYELLFRSGNVDHAVVGDDRAASAAVIDHVLSDLGISAALGAHRGFINVDASLLMSDAVKLLPRDSIVLEILETVAIDDALIQRVKALRAAGFTLALDDISTLDEDRRALLRHVDIAKVDLPGMDNYRLRRLARELKESGVKLLAEKVDSSQQVELCKKLGFDLFQGYYFARPTLLSGRKLSHSQLTLMRLLDLILTDADTPAIEAALKPEPGLTVNLLRLTNSVGIGSRRRIESLRDAIVHLGRRQLQRWLQLLMFTDASAKERFPSPLLVHAAARGRFMECATTSTGGDSQAEDRAFVTGIMSLMPALLAIPISEIVASVHLGDDIADGLLEHGGKLGAMLALAESLDGGNSDAINAALAGIPGIDMQIVSQCLAEALRWSNAIGEGSLAS